MQVPAAEVRGRLRVRAVLLVGARGGAVRGHPQGVRREQRVEAAPPRTATRPLRGGRHRRLRGPGAAPRSRVRLCLANLRPTAAGIYLHINLSAIEKLKLSKNSIILIFLCSIESLNLCLLLSPIQYK